MNDFTLVFVACVAAGLCLQSWLAFRHIRHVSQHKAQVPDAFAETVSLPAHQKAADYTVAKNHLGLVEMWLGAVMLLIWTLGGGLQLLDQVVSSMGMSPVFTGVTVMISMMLISQILDLPMSLYSTFRLEQRFEFNRTTLPQFVSDLLKGIALLFVIGIPLAWVVLWLMNMAGTLWWFKVWAVWMSFNLLMLWAYPNLIAPLFNKFTPLEDIHLKEKIETLINRCGFTSSGVFVMDGSRRSGHGNAYFSGMGKSKRIVFFDTLMESLQPDELEAVLAHELGHFKCMHIRKRLVMMSVLSLSGLAVLGWLIDQPWFYAGLGVSEPSKHMALILFMLTMPVFSVFLSPLFAMHMRKQEFEADDFAIQQASPTSLVQALVKLYRENASTLTPDPLHSSFYDSHPPAPVRINHILAQVKT